VPQQDFARLVVLQEPLKHRRMTKGKGEVVPLKSENLRVDQATGRCEGEEAACATQIDEGELQIYLLTKLGQHNGSEVASTSNGARFL
jgi:hypothetical protein